MNNTNTIITTPEFIEQAIEIAMPRPIHISFKNRKMGEIASVSFPAGREYYCLCDKCEEECYGNRYCRYRANVRNNYIDNYELYEENPDEYWRQVRAFLDYDEIKYGDSDIPRGFRYNVCGDMPSHGEFYWKVNETADMYPHRKFLIYTKNYGLVNHYIDINGEPEKNLYTKFSRWRGYECDNKYDLPEVHVLYKDGSSTLEEGKEAELCNGDCFACMVQGKRCYNHNCKNILIPKH